MHIGECGTCLASNHILVDLPPSRVFGCPDSRSWLLQGQKQLELWGQLLLRVEAVREVDAANAAIGMDLHPQRLYVICACKPHRVSQYAGTCT